MRTAVYEGLSHKIETQKLKNHKPFFLLILIHFILCLHGYAQNSVTDSKKDYSATPAWIPMMNDPNTNYYEAIKAFDTYFLTHPMPVMEEEEKMGEENDLNEMKREVEKEKKKDKNVVLSADELKKKNDDEVLKYNIKKFNRWKRDVKPYVQEDGRILTDAERMKIILQQEEEKKQLK